jgi:multidrug efflux system outer membrane protein
MSATMKRIPMKTKQKIHRVAAAAGLAALLCGCANLAPSYERPAAPVAPSWPQAAAAAAPGEAATPAQGWQQFYAEDARLRELITLALQHNRDLRVAALNAEQARALARVADANRWPTVGVGLTGTRATTTKDTISSTYTAGLQLASYEIDLLGKARNNADAATSRYLASVEGQRAAQISLVASVAAAQLALQADDELLALAERTLASRRESLKLTQLKFEQGAASRLELSTAESAEASARASVAQLRRQRAQDENALVLLIGQPLPATLPAARPLADLKLAALPAGLPSNVLLQRPDVLQAEQTLIAANANIGAARAAFFPAITLTASAGSASTQLSELFKSGAWSFSSQLLMPIFDAGRLQANLESVKTTREIAVAQYEKALQSAFREVADALAGQATLGEQLQAQQALARAEAERLRLVELRFANGASNSLELLDAQRSSYAAQQALLQAQLALQINRVQLYKALGGGLAGAGT